MNTGGVIKGGLLAGLVLNITEGVLHGVLLRPQWTEVMNATGMTEPPSLMAFYVVGGFAVGILAVWLYAAVRPRLGAGPGTAVKVGLVVWALGWVWMTVPMALGGLAPWSLAGITLIAALIELPVATVAGAWLYKEDGSGAGATASAAPPAPPPPPAPGSPPAM